jgi:hypothetical protein
MGMEKMMLRLQMLVPIPFLFFRNTSMPGSVSFDTRIDLAVGTTPKSCTIADLNADGKPDLLVANAASLIL